MECGVGASTTATAPAPDHRTRRRSLVGVLPAATPMCSRSTQTSDAIMATPLVRTYLEEYTSSPNGYSKIPPIGCSAVKSTDQSRRESVSPGQVQLDLDSGGQQLGHSPEGHRGRDRKLDAQREAAAALVYNIMTFDTGDCDVLVVNGVKDSDFYVKAGNAAHRDFLWLSLKRQGQVSQVFGL